MADLMIQHTADGAQPLNPNPAPNLIDRMPAELINEIICYALVGPLAEDHDDRILSILHVSSRWRKIALNSREFISNVPVPWPAASREQTEEWLLRTRPFPIRIRAPAYVEGVTLESDDYADHPILGPLEVALRNDNLLRVREIHIEGRRGEHEDHLRPIPVAVVLNHLVNLGSDVSLPLEILRIRSDEPQRLHYNATFPIPSSDAWPIFPSLRLVDVKGGEIPPYLPWFASPALTTVLLEGVIEEGLWDSWDDLQCELAAFSDTVEILTLETYTLPSDMNADEAIPVLPNLRYLEVTDTPDAVAKLLHNVHFPYTTSFHFSFLLGREDLQTYKTSTLPTDYWKLNTFQELAIESSEPDRISWIARPSSGVAQAGAVRLDVQGDGGFLPEHHEFLLTYSARLLINVCRLVIRTPHFPSRAVWHALLLLAPIQEMVITSGNALAGWMEAMPGPTGIPIPRFVIPRLVIMHTTFHGSEAFMHFAQFLRSGGSHGFGKVSFVGCTFEGMTREAFQTILKIIGCLVFCTGCRGRVDVSGDGM